MPASSAAANGGHGATARAKTSNRGDDDATANGGQGATALAKTGNSGDDDDATASASAKTGKPPVGGQRQVQSRKRGRPGHLALGSQERPGMQTCHPLGPGQSVQVCKHVIHWVLGSLV